MVQIKKSFPTTLVDKLAERESFRKELVRPIYHIHKYWAKRLGSVFRAIVLYSLSNGTKDTDFYGNYDFKGKVVLDPFMGSGTTLGEAIKLGASVVGCDTNPLSSFIVEQSLTRVDLAKLELEFLRIKSDLQTELQKYYQTIVPKQSLPSTALYYFWAKVVSDDDGNEIPLLNNYILSKNAYPTKKPEASLLCPNCGHVYRAKYNSQLEICQKCHFEFNPQIGPVKGANCYNDKGEKFSIKALVNKHTHPPKHKLLAVLALDENGKRCIYQPTDFDFDVLAGSEAEFDRCHSELPLPNMHVRDGYNTNQAIGYNYQKWSDFFSKRQLLVLGKLYSRILKIEDATIRNHFICLFSGTLEFNNLFCSYKGEGTGAVRHMFYNHIIKPEKIPLENNVWGIERRSSGSFTSLYESRLKKAKEYLDNPFEIKLSENPSSKYEKITCANPFHNKLIQKWDQRGTEQFAMVLNGDSSSLQIPNESIDAVVTDPPYFDFVHYSELSDFFYAWVSLSDPIRFGALADSSHENEVQDTDERSFSKKLQSVFLECNRVLKSEGVMCFSFHHSRISGWTSVYEAITGAGFQVCQFHPIKAEMAVASPKSLSSSPINIDSILVCQKRGTVVKTNKADDLCEKCLKLYSIKESDLVNVGRALSKGDRFVIALSSAMLIASAESIKSDEFEKLCEKVVKNLFDLD